MTVQEWFEGDRIYREDLEESARESLYSARATLFILQNWDYDIETLTEKQAAWATRILDDMVERRIEAQRRRSSR